MCIIKECTDAMGAADAIPRPCRHRKRLRLRGFLAAFSFIYGDYKDEYYYWESVVMARKFIIVVVVVFLTNGTQRMCRVISDSLLSLKQ
jgi:hypothetical protein